jgi:hypothetical protein
MTITILNEAEVLAAVARAQAEANRTGVPQPVGYLMQVDDGTVTAVDGLVHAADDVAAAPVRERPYDVAVASLLGTVDQLL